LTYRSRRNHQIIAASIASQELPATRV